MTTKTHKPRQRPRSSVVAAVLHELLNVEAFDSLADAAEALKERCARLRIPYDAAIVSAAFAEVAHAGRAIVREPARRLVERPPEPEIFTRAEASRLYAELLTRARGVR